ncbi:MAG: tRNA (adenosine(37)-N6)-threonylcarbamoyltransferase complex ATPase subunit type 1 TsaE [Actinomycetota bacterium]
MTSSAEQTRAVGEAVAPILRPGDVLSLTGDLGAGKTTFVQGVGRGLGVEQPVVSPTFTLVREYRGTLPIYHLDVYRLSRIQDVLELGFDEMIDEGALVLIEWGDAIEALLPESSLQVELHIADDGETRRILLSPRGPRWAPRERDLAAAVATWSAGT